MAGKIKFSLLMEGVKKLAILVLNDVKSSYFHPQPRKSNFKGNSPVSDIFFFSSSRGYIGMGIT